jgi:hypothetical protein
MSQYYTPFRIDEASAATNTAKYQTVALGVGTVSTSTSLTSRRILITTGAYPVFVAFGTAPVTAVNSGFQIPANAQMIFNFKTGDKVAAISASASAISIIDLD